MLDENISVTVDIAAPVAAKVDAAAEEYQGEYTLNNEAYMHMVGAYKMFRKFALQNDGGIKTADVGNVDKVSIVAEVPSVDLFRDGLDLFAELLEAVDSIDVATSKDGDLIIEVSVAGIWKAV